MFSGFGEVVNSLTRPLVTLTLTAVLAGGVLSGRVSQDQFMPIVAMVIAFWFGSRQGESKPAPEQRG